ncbi:SRPBCC domain-containing protein [uncultured Roseobacter sp.]|uniref:SRPBCC family protein n=1 Tax=uncultured Roseobacter sp. TaxID=114847 RepID=UPI0026185E03|nr:SRPBCC domain-containing protein [uncultured Roseobacter sp.]
MAQKNYERTIRTTASRSEAYAALTTGFTQWWTSDSGTFEKPGDVAKFGFSGKLGYWKFKATSLEPNRVELECVEALHLHEGQPKEIETEWLGTRAIWDIQETVGGTEIHFVHDGLTPDLLCFDICEAGWDMFFVDSLQAYLDTGTGKPHV